MRTLVISKNVLEPVTSQVRNLLRLRVDPQGPVTLSFDDIDKAPLPEQTDLAVVVLSPDSDKCFEVLRRIRKAVRGQLLAVGQAQNSKLILRALQSGADYYMDQDDLEKEFEAGLSRLTIQVEQAPAGRLLAVLSAAGGTGASTLAANIAAVLAQEEKKCALIDLKPGRGDLASLLDLKPQFTVADMCENAGRLDHAMFEKMLVRHPSGVHLLGSPQMYREIKRVTAAGVGQGLQMARTFYPCVVVDLEDCFHEEQVVALRQATGVLLVTRLDFTSLRNTRRILDYTQELDIPQGRIRVVVSRYGQPNELPVDDAEDALGQKLSHFIPEDPKTVNGANNAGLLVVQRAPQSKVAQAIIQTARASMDRRRHERAAMAVGGS